VQDRLRAIRVWHHQALHFVTSLQQHIQVLLLTGSAGIGSVFCNCSHSSVP
jgi:hypothetical protein